MEAKSRLYSAVNAKLEHYMTGTYIQDGVWY